MNLIDKIFSVIAPSYCLNCGYEGAVICTDCQVQFNDIVSSCYRCHKATRNYKPCADHISKNRPQHVYMAYEYKDLAKELIMAYKFEQAREAAYIIAAHLDELLPYYADPPLISYAPTTSMHIRDRGFDHAKLIAKELARLRGYNYATLLVRTSKIQQIGATRQERMTQLKNALRLTNTKIANNRHVLLVDDVVTTGATLEACTGLLLKSGVSQVDAVVFARTPKTKK
jgi:ComF family protein